MRFFGIVFLTIVGTNKTHTVSPSGFLPQLSHTQPLIDSTNLPPQLQSIKSPIHLKRPVDQLISLGSTYSSQSSLSQCQACLGLVFSSSPHLLQCPLGMFKELLSLIYLSFLLVYLLIENERMGTPSDYIRAQGYPCDYPRADGVPMRLNERNTIH